MSTVSHELPDDIDALKAIVHRYRREAGDLHGANKILQNEITYLQERVKQLTATLFGRKSEKLAPEDLLQGRLFNEAEEGSDHGSPPPAEKRVRIGAHERKKPGRKPIPAYIPREEIVVDIPEHEKVCACGETLVRIGEESSEKLDIIPAKVVVKRTVRPKYACKNCEGLSDESSPAVRTAPLPPSILPKSIATPGLLAYIFT